MLSRQALPNPEPVCHPDQFCQRVRLHFPHDLATVNTDCDFTGTQLGAIHELGYRRERRPAAKDFDVNWNAALETAGILAGEEVAITWMLSSSKRNRGRRARQHPSPRHLPFLADRGN